MNVVYYILIGLFSLLSLSVGYLYVLGMIGLLARRRRREPVKPWRFLVMVPAHNESLGIEESLKRMTSLEPVGTTDILVIADNCTDNTAELARKFDGVRVLEREDRQQRGKGYALQWAFQRVTLEDYDAVAIVDADTLVQRNMAKAMVASFERGFGAVQLSNELLVAQPTPLSRLQRMANAVENRLFWNGRAAVGLPILLRGTGMAMTTEVLREHPFDSHELAEDTDFAVNLLLIGVKIDFCRASAVRSAAPSDYVQSYVQKDRWASGTARVARRAFWPLIREGIFRFRPGLIELIPCFFLLSRPLVMYHVVGAMLLTFLAPVASWPLFWIWGGLLIAALIAYLATGVFLVHDRRATARALLAAPYFGAWMFLIQLRAVFSGRQRDWVRTERMPKAPSTETDYSKDGGD